MFFNWKNKIKIFLTVEYSWKIDLQNGKQEHDTTTHKNEIGWAWSSSAAGGDAEAEDEYWYGEWSFYLHFHKYLWQVASVVYLDSRAPLSNQKSRETWPMHIALFGTYDLSGLIADISP